MALELKDYVKAAKSIVFVTGAGISQPSGLMTFRDNEGNEKDGVFPNETCELLGITKKLVLDIPKAQPNIAHEAITKLQASSKDVVVITQNIDGLHQKSGFPASRILELHGNTSKGLASIGQEVNEAALGNATKRMIDCDLLIIVGTSLMMDPLCQMVDDACYRRFMSKDAVKKVCIVLNKGHNSAVPFARLHDARCVTQSLTPKTLGLE